MIFNFPYIALYSFIQAPETHSSYTHAHNESQKMILDAVYC